MSSPRDASASAKTAWFVTALAFVVYLAFQQESFWSDGRSLIFRAEAGHWRHHVLAYLPAAQIARSAARPLFGDDTERSLLLLSALCASGAVGLVTRAAGLFGAGTLAAAASGLLTAFAPPVFFYATCVEVHALQLLAAAVTVYAIACSSRASDAVPDARLLTLLFGALVATHPTGLLWAPAFAVYAFTASGRWRRPRRMILPALGLLLVAAWSGFELSQGPSITRGHFKAALFATLTRWDMENLASEFLAQGAVLLALSLVWALRFPWKAVHRHRVFVAIALLLPFVLVLPAQGIEERGAYYISLFPVLCVLSALGLSRVGRLAPALALLLVPLQAAAAHRFVWEWEHDYPGRPWAEVFVTEAKDNGFLFALEAWEREAIWKHSHMNATCLRFRLGGEEREAPVDAVVLKDMCKLYDATFAKGGLVAVTQSVLDYAEENADLRRFLDALEERYGEPEHTLRAEYLVYPAPAAKH